MKIAFDAKRYYHNKTGLGNYSRTLVKAITEQYKEVVPALYDESPLSRTFSLGRKAKEDGCDIFHGLSNELPRDIVRCNIPSVVTIHDVAWRTFPAMYKPIDRFIYDVKYGWSAKHATKVIAISQSTKRDIMRFYHVPSERIEVIYQPVQDIFYHPCPSPTPEEQELISKPYILTVGSINSRKNLLGMLKAYAMIPVSERPRFIVVGNGREYRRECEVFISNNNLSDVVIYDNISDARTLQILYAHALVMMYPSFYEGFGLPVVEAALQRCPIITSNVSSLPEAAGPGAIQVDPYNVDAIYDALHRLLTDRTECVRLGNAAYDYAMSHFSPSILTEQLYELYLSL